MADLDKVIGKRTVSHELHPVCRAECAKLLPLTLRVKLALVDVRHVIKAWLVQDLLDVLLQVVRDTDGSHALRRKKLLHRPPRFFALLRPAPRPVYDVQVQIIKPQPRQRGVKRRERAVISAGRVDLRTHKQLVTRDP